MRVTYFCIGKLDVSRNPLPPLSINEEDPFYGFSIIRPSIYSTY